MSGRGLAIVQSYGKHSGPRQLMGINGGPMLQYCDCHELLGYVNGTQSHSRAASRGTRLIIMCTRS